MRKRRLRYKRQLLYKDKKVEIVLIFWPSPSKSLPHDHGRSRGTIRVIEGEVYQDVFSKKTKKFLYRSYHAAGSIIKESLSTIHIMGNCGFRPARTVHTYRPPLKMKNYRFEELKFSDNVK
ncbi:MAG: cysteine dioxygenase family protein [Patescibacteria group bacterium]